MNETESFETRFLRVAYFSGHHSLDPILLSLLALKVQCTLFRRPDGRHQLVNSKNLVKKISKKSRVLFSSYKRMKDHPSFNLVDFCYENGIEQDKIGTHHLVFNNPRVVWHVLSLTNAIVLTLRMHKAAEFQIPQRISKGWTKSSKNLYTLVFCNLLTQVRRKRYTDSKEKDLIKLFKNSLCRLVSVAFEQDELPEGDFIEVLPKVLHETIKKRFSKDSYSQLMFSILQSKSLCEEVPETFIQESLEKHRKQLSTPSNPLSSETLAYLRERGRQFGKNVKRHYDPNKGYMPTNKATYQFPRDKGGVKGDLVFNGYLDFESKPQFDPDDRPEPFVIGLFGQPGSGKSTEINRLISEISGLFPGVKNSNLVYQRTCNVEHWDGYRGQPITVLDDLGQSAEAADIQEFQTLVSCCPYILPMADLKEKGMKFNSPIIICTSNLSFGECLGQKYGKRVIIDENSFWRRFHQPIFTEMGKKFTLVNNYTFVDPTKLLFKGLDPLENLNVVPTALGVSNNNPYLAYKKKLVESWKPFDEKIYSQIRERIKQRWLYHQNYSMYWRQTVISGKNSHNDYYDWLHSQDLPEEIESLGGTDIGKTHIETNLVFNSFPPVHPLPVRVEPIVEPLKVRTITAGMGSTFSLKPFQVAMWKALDHEPQFTLTHGTNRLDKAISRIFEKSEEGDVWISGDYTAATDSIPIEASKALMEGILESIDHLPTKRWALKELSQHLLVYPKSSGLEPVLQQSGQLMGSLLSFPLLCLLNDCTAKLAGMSSDKYLINGDDILMRGSPAVYQKWKGIVSEVGLELSLGKNYIHPYYGTVNSQMIINDQVVNSGKQCVLDRRNHILGECLRDLQLQMSETPTEEVNNLFLSVNRQKLRRTVRGMGIPYSHGGLGFSWDESRIASQKNPELYKLIYHRDLLNRIKPLANHLSVPYFSKKGKSDQMLKLKQEQCLNPTELKEFHEDFLRIQGLDKIKQRILGSGSLRELFSRDIRDYPPLPFIQTFQIPIKPNLDSKRIQEIIYAKFFQELVEGSLFKYSDFRKHVLEGLCDVEHGDEEEIKLSFTLFDFPPDLEFPELDLNFKVTDYSKEHFQKKLKKELNQKDLGVSLNDFSGEDFSLEVESCVETWNNIYCLFPQCTDQELREEKNFSLSEFISNQKCD